jgi:transcriptional regulator with XRE-family HTH domain
MARAALKLGVRDLAALAHVSPNTITRIEADSPSNSSTIAAIRAALEAAGVIFVDENSEGPGVRLRKQPETVAALTEKIEELQEVLPTVEPETEPSPAKAMKQLERARGKNEIVKLKSQRKRLKNKDPK